MLKAIHDSEEQVIVPKRLLNKFMEAKNMSEEENKIVEEVIEEAVKEEVVEEEAKPEVSELNPEIVIDEKAIKEAEEKASKEAELVAELKAMVEEQDKKIEKQAAELKALKESEVFKSPITIKPELKTIEANIDMLGLIN